MNVTFLRFLALLFTALALAPAAAHVLELPNKMGTQVVFWTFTFPANQATENWTQLPENWEALRTQWEYSHAASAALNLAALVAVFVSVLARDRS